jgi:hypothetical protein
MGERARVAHLDAAFVTRAVQAMRASLETAIDRMKLAADPVPVVLVGGGHVLVGDELAGASSVLRPAHCDVANAIGAAIAQVGGEIERVYDLSAMRREAAVEAAKQEAEARARAAGAIPSSIGIVEVEEVPLTYLPSNATRIHVKAVGDLAA